MRRYQGKCDVFFGIEHRLRKEETEEQFNKEAKKGWRFAADAPRITDETAGSEDRKHTSGGVFCGNRQQARNVTWTCSFFSRTSSTGSAPSGPNC